MAYKGFRDTELVRAAGQEELGAGYRGPAAGKRRRSTPADVHRAVPLVREKALQSPLFPGYLFSRLNFAGAPARGTAKRTAIRISDLHSKANATACPTAIQPRIIKGTLDELRIPGIQAFLRFATSLYQCAAVMSDVG
jgi:hypothetical protein